MRRNEMPKVITEVEVVVDLRELQIDDLMDELEDRGYSVVCGDNRDESIQAKERIMDDIHNLYQDFILWNDTMMTNENFGTILKNFFSEHLDKNVL
jgi:hypothetical protein